MRRKLGIFETAQTISGNYFPFNAVACVRITNSPLPDIVQRTLSLMQERHPLLRMRIARERTGFAFVSDGTPDIGLEILQREEMDQWRSACENELNKKFDIEKGPLIRCLYLYSDSQPKEGDIIISCHHSIIDATSVLRIIHELLSMSAILQRGEIPQNYSPLPLLQSEEAYYPSAFKGISKKSHILRFIFRQVKDEFSYRSKTRGGKKSPVYKSARCCTLSHQLSPEQTHRLIRQTRQKRVSLNSCLSAAMILSVVKKLYDNQDLPLRHFTFSDLRPYLKPPVPEHSLGSYHSMMRLTVPVKKDQGIWDLAQNIHQQVYRMLKKGEKFIQPLLSARMMRMFIRLKKMRMGTTALSYPGVAKIFPDYGEIQVRALHGYVSNFPVGPEYAATARIFNRRLWMDSLYLDSDMSRETAQQIANEILFILEERG